MAFKNLSQRDSRWKDELLGFSKTTTIGSHGCTLTCIAILAGLTPREVNDKLKSVNGFAYENLIIWKKINEAIPWLEWEWRGWSYNNDEVKKAIEENGACLVEVDFDGKISTPKDKHWVTYIGGQRMIDPWTRNEKSTGWYPKTTGYAVIKIKKQETSNNKSEYVKTLEADRERFWKLSEEQKVTIEGFKEEVKGLRNELEKAKQASQEALKEIAQLLGVETDLPKIKGSISEALSIEDAKREAEHEVIRLTQKAGVFAEKTIELEEKIKEMKKDIIKLKADETENKKEIEDLQLIKEKLRKELAELKKKLLTSRKKIKDLLEKEKKTVNGYSGWDLIGLGITKILKRGEKK